MSSRALRERSWGPLLEIVSQDINASRGTPYPCSQRTINATDHFSHHNERPYVSASQAIRELVEHNNLRRSPPPHERDAIRRLSSAVDNAMSGDWGRDLIIKCFIDLDTVFFGGLLRGNVTLDWGDPADWIMLELEVGEGTLGVTLPVPHGRAEIVLNARTVLFDPFESDPLRTMFATTLHEMCHAVELVHVRPDQWSERDFHGPHFGSRIHAVDRRAWELLGLEAVEAGEFYRRCHDTGRAWGSEGLRGFGRNRY